MATTWVAAQFGAGPADAEAPADPDAPIEAIAVGTGSSGVSDDAPAAAPVAAIDLVGMVSRDDQASGGLRLITTHGAEYALDVSQGEIEGGRDPEAAPEWHAGGRVSGEDEGSGLAIVVAESIRPFNQVVERVVEVIRDAPTPAPVTEPAEQPAETPAAVAAPEVTMSGTIVDDWVAVGGETTGVAIRKADNEVIELDLGEARAVFESVSNNGWVNWIVTGVLEEREYPTRGVVPTIRVTDLRLAGPEDVPGDAENSENAQGSGGDAQGGGR